MFLNSIPVQSLRLNCFYRIVDCLNAWTQKLEDNGFQSLVFEDGMSELLAILNKIGAEEPLTVPDLEQKIRNGDISHPIVMLLRLITSCELQCRRDYFMHFLEVNPQALVALQSMIRTMLSPAYLAYWAIFQSQFSICMVQKHPVWTNCR